MDQDDIIYFQGRRIPGSSMEPKYKNPVAEKSLIIHNESNFGRDKYIVVTEGLIDCSMVGNQGTTMLGVEAANEFIKKLLQMTNKGVIMAYDNDEPGMKALKGFMNGSKYRKRVKYFLMPDEYKDAKDINMLQIEHKISDIYEFMVNNANDYFITSARMGVQNAYN
jgi:DNA primase